MEPHQGPLVNHLSDVINERPRDQKHLGHSHQFPHYMVYWFSK